MSECYTIRAATVDDAPELARLLTELGHPTSSEEIGVRWNSWVREGNTALVAATEGGALLGVATLNTMTVLHRPQPVGRISALVLNESARGSGIGRALVDAAERHLAAAGCGLLEVTSNNRLTSAHTFYTHLGYKQTSLRFAKKLADPNS